MAHHTLNGIHIPAGCRWIDEFDWTPVESSVERSVSGALIIDQSARLAGRPITLQASDNAGWYGMTRAVVAQLYTLASQTGQTHALILADGRQFDVVFSPGEEAISAAPLADTETPSVDWPYIITLRLITV
jgi:hypothetical protein